MTQLIHRQSLVQIRLDPLLKIHTTTLSVKSAIGRSHIERLEPSEPAAYAGGGEGTGGSWCGISVLRQSRFPPLFRNFASAGRQGAKLQCQRGDTTPITPSVVECRICNREVAGSNLGRGYFAPRSTQPSIPPGSANEYQITSMPFLPVLRRKLKTH